MAWTLTLCGTDIQPNSTACYGQLPPASPLLSLHMRSLNSAMSSWQPSSTSSAKVQPSGSSS